MDVGIEVHIFSDLIDLEGLAYLVSFIPYGSYALTFFLPASERFSKFLGVECGSFMETSCLGLNVPSSLPLYLISDVSLCSVPVCFRRKLLC